jgi:hypothetical protein
VRETTVRLPPPPDDDDDSGDVGAFGVPRGGVPLGLTEAPPAPPPPPLVVEAEKHTAFIDDGFEKLSVLVQQWRHNQGVTRCLEQVVAEGADVRDGGAAAQRRLYAAIDRGDQAAATSEARRLSDGARSFEALYQRARLCVTTR